ncbi:MAG TPA: hypothetical protein VFA77_15260, partial [Candidatus Eisenbacteria bacterium]|nr:hypothetical protein [Candidatus Eisenbacteria bacterium]
MMMKLVKSVLSKNLSSPESRAGVPPVLGALRSQPFGASGTWQPGRLPYVGLLLCFALLLTPGCSKQAKKERHLKAAESYYAAKDFKKAEIEYLNVLKLDRTNTMVVKRLGTIYFDQGKAQQALSFLLAARKLDQDDI